MFNRLKRIVCLICILVLSTSYNNYAFSNYYNTDKYEADFTDKIIFDYSKYIGMSELEAGIAKVNEYAISDNIAKNMEPEVLKAIGRSQYMSRKIVYLTEQISIDSSVSENVYSRGNIFKDKTDSSLIEIDKSTYDNMVKEAQEYQLSKILNNVIVKSEDGDILNKANTFGSDETTTDIDSGKAIMYLDCYHYVDSNNNYCYEVVNQFKWDVMPKNRGTDIFGISRDNNTKFIPNSFGGYYEYLHNKYGGYVSQSGYWNPPLISSEVKHFDCNNDSLNNFHSTIRIDMPNDIAPEFVVVGRYYSADIYPQLIGITWYRGTLETITAPATYNFNHWGTLAHQVKGKISLNPSFSVNYPIGALFYIAPTYEKNFNYITTCILDTIYVTLE